MRRLYTITAVVLLTQSIWAQSPQKMSYQAVIRDNTDHLVTNHAVGMRLSILQGTTDGAEVYTETKTPTTSANGLVTIEIGDVPGFNTIDWSNGPYFLKTETDPTGGTNYTITGTSQLLSVPYAFYAKTADYNLLLNKPTILNSQWTSSGNNIYFNSGKIGIGTTPSEYLLDIAGRTRFLTGGATRAGIWFTNSDDSQNRALIGMFDDDHFGFYSSGGAEWDFKMNLNNGNLGIGITNSPATKLEVNGVITASGANS